MPWQLLMLTTAATFVAVHAKNAVRSTECVFMLSKYESIGSCEAYLSTSFIMEVAVPPLVGTKLDNTHVLNIMLNGQT